MLNQLDVTNGTKKRAGALPMNHPDEPTEQSLTLKKLELEIKQLEVDLRKYDERIALSDRKLRSDVRDWYWRIIVALVSAVVGVVTFLWAQSYQRYTDEFKSVSTRIDEDDKGFFDALDKLSNASPSIRLTAADRLVTFAEMVPATPKPPSPFQRFWASLVGRTDSTELFNLGAAATRRRKMNAIQAAAARLHFEDDVRVMESLGEVLLAGGEASIPSVAEANRSLANELTRNFGSLIANDQTGHPTSNACDDWASHPDLTQRIDQLVVRVQMPYQSVNRELRFVPSQFFLHSFALKEFVTIQCHLDTKASRRHLVASSTDALESRTIRNARALALTSYILIRLLQAGQAKAQGSNRVDLEAVQLVTGTGSGKISWANVDLDNAYISGTPAYFSCKECSLRFAALQDLNLSNGSDLTTSDTTGAHFR